MVHLLHAASRTVLLSTLVLSAALSGCQPAEPVPGDTEAPAPDPADDVSGVQSISPAWQAAAQAGDPAAITTLHSDDAILLPAGEPSVQGREALSAFFSDRLSEPADITASRGDAVVSDAGDMAYKVGTTANGRGKFLAVYRKVGGSWLIVGDAWSEDATPTAPD